MVKRMRTAGMCLLAFWPLQSFAQDGRTRAVEVYATTQASPPQITLHWNSSPYTVEVHKVFRRAPGASTWVYLGNDPAPTATSFIDTTATPGVRYEYKVYREYVFAEMSFHARGYTIAGIDAPLLDQRGSVVLVIDSTQQAALATEIAQFQRDLAGDGWTVLTETAAPTDTPASVRAKLQSRYNADPANVKAAILLGRIPVPYSGSISPDGHTPDHNGAWPADTYYADLTGTWTDSTVNNSGANQIRNRNIPGDGKFDQSNLPSDADIAIGRIDMANMSGFGAGANETELLRNYLQKNHEFRHQLGAYSDVPRRGLIRDGFGSLSGESPASVAWRGFTAMFGPANVTQSANWFPTLETNKYLWAYGSGSGGYTSASSIGTSTDFKTKNSLAVFNILFGSYFGDWDSPTDNFLRAPLAGAAGSLGLVSAWGNRADWQIHGMTLGETIGDAYLRTVNNPSDWSPNWDTGYFTRSSTIARMVHMALMGDPTLRLHPITSPETGTVTRTPGGTTDSVQLTWTAVSDPDLIGYHIYRSADPFGSFTRLTTTPTTNLSYTDASAPQTALYYQVRAVVLTTSASGTYHNAGQALAFTVPVAPPAAPSDFAAASATTTAFSLPLTWTPDPLADSHRIERSTAGASGPWTLLNAAVAGTATSFTDTGLTPETTYYYRIRSTNVAGDSVWSDTVSATTFPDAPLAVIVPSTEVDETSGSFTATVARALTTGSQVFQLSSNDARLSLPATVTIPDGQNSVNFTVTVADDAIINPNDIGTITAFAPAALIGESFTGAVDSPVNTQNTGWGWGAGWYSSNTPAVLVEPSLAYTKNGTINSAGTRAIRLNSTGGSDARRNFATKYTTGDVWVSTLLHRNSGNWGTQIILRENTDGGINASVVYENNTNHWRIKTSTGSSAQILASNPSGQVLFIVMHFDFANQQIHAWLNPDVSGTTPTNALGSATVPMPAGLTGISRLDLFGYSTLDGFDEVRVATSFPDLLGGTTVTTTVTLLDDEAPGPSLTPREQWWLEKFGITQTTGFAALDADPNGNGLSNLLEYALANGDPLTPGLTSLPQVGTTTIAENDYLTLTVPKNPGATDVTYIVETSTDLSTWQSGEGNTVIVSETASELVVRTAAAISDDARRFLRLRVTAQ